MRRNTLLRIAALLLLSAPVPGSLHARQQDSGIAIDADDLGGVVTSAKGPEAGVWVIAETRDLPTRFIRIVVTDDLGRYVVPDLPKASYDVWVRGYGLVDSPKVKGGPGQRLNLTAVVAPTPRAAADYYPANYWASLLKIPAESEFSGSPEGRGFTVDELRVSPPARSQKEFLGILTTNGCVTCHQLGTRVTRELPRGGGPFSDTKEAWDTRVQFGQSGAFMTGQLSQLHSRPRALAMFADWTERIQKGELPPQPPRPSGIERNIVVTSWAWGGPGEFVHDEIATDERNPTLNANGPLYGSMEFSGDALILDPVSHKAERLNLPLLDPKDQPPLAWNRSALKPSPYWGEEIFWNSRTVPHNPMMDQKGRVWFTAAVRGSQNPAWCDELPSAQYRKLGRSGRHLVVYDPKTKKATPIDTCFGTHHIEFAFDQDHTIWVNSGGFFKTRVWDETGDIKKAQGWVTYIVDTNGNGKQDAYVGVDDPIDPTKDKMIAGGGYDISASPFDGSVWLAQSGTPGRIYRIAPGPNPPMTSLTEVYEIPNKDGAHTVRGGPELDKHGVAWMGLGSGHMASFDRRKCKVVNGPTAVTGTHCPEGWTMYRMPGPRFQGTDGWADAHYLSWTDPFNTSGLGENTPFTTGSNSDSLIAMLPGGKFVNFRVPYPMGFLPKGMDGRIDDPKGGWKGRGIWSTYAGQVMWHQEGGKGETPKVVKFQVRPNPLAK